MNRVFGLGLALALGILEAKAGDTNDLTVIGLDELMRVKVFSVTKHLQPWFESPAAVYVITGEEIRRSGATTIPEALRLAPGLNVARVNLHAWAVSARGFNNLFSDKLLVMVDGRSVYTPVFSGVWWSVNDLMLEDIDRIEVVRGVDGTVWGANAVNGVINIITKPARQTQGTLATAGGGNEEQGFGAVRCGGQINEQTWFRVYAKGFNRAEDIREPGMEDVTRCQQLRGGFRLDHERDHNTATLQGDLFWDESGGIGLFPDPLSQTGQFSDSSPFRTWGGNLLGRWTHEDRHGGEWRLQAYYDHERRSHDYAINEERHTGDIELQHRLLVGARQFVTWGGGLRISADRFEPTYSLDFKPSSRQFALASAFVQDEIVIVPDRVRLTLGTRLEYNSYTDFEVQPTVRVAWTPTPHQTIWAAVARAVRIPSRADRDGRLNYMVVGPGVLGQLQGSSEFESEKVVGFELGYRLAPRETLALDFTAFHNRYEDLRGILPGVAYLEGGITIVPLLYGNRVSGETVGGEFTVDWRPTRWYRLRASYSGLDVQLHEEAGAIAYSGEDDSPHHQVMLRQSLDLPGNLSADLGVRYVGRLSSLNVPGYIAGDARLAWRPHRQWELAVVGQQLFHDRHLEFGRSLVVPSATVPQSVYGQVTYRY